jgi:lipid-binding SYLF domain-containing protein
MNRALLTMCLFAGAAMLVGCGSSPKTDEERDALNTNSQGALKDMQAKDPGLADFMRDAYGYVSFPSVGKGGLIVGGAYGRGTVYEHGNAIGYAELEQGTVGAQIGGQSYRELIVFQNAAAFDRFTSGQFSFSANASAVALKAGAAAAAKYEDGVAIFTMPTGGLMAEASIGGQKFIFHPYDSERHLNSTETRTTTETRTRNYD